MSDDPLTRAMLDKNDLRIQGWSAIVIEHGQYLPDTANVTIPAGLLRQLLEQLEKD